MRTWLKPCLVALGLMAAWALAPPSAIAGIAGTDHDFSSVAPGGQLCVACHTPHHANSTLLLWNHVLSSLNYSWSDATKTTGGTTLPTNIKTWSGSTKNCLSCHDGTVEIGKLYHPAVTFVATKISGDAQIATATGDLKGNHPVAVPYPYGGLKNTYNGITTGDLALPSGWVATPTDVKIFADASVVGPSNRGVECASCHDPHGTAFDEFLRASTSGSAICLKCHVK